MSTTIVIGAGELQDLTASIGEAGLSGLDRKLLKLAAKRKTGEEMGEALNIPPARAMQRVREILRTRNWLTVLEQKALLNEEMHELKNILFERVRKEGGTYENKHGQEYWTFGDPRWSANLIKVLKELNGYLTASELQHEEEERFVDKEQARAMGEVLESAFKSFTKRLREDHPEIAEIYLRDLMEDSLNVAFVKLDEMSADPEDDE